MFSQLKSRLRLHLTGGFASETRGAIAVELVIVLPLLLWALAATAVFFDGFRTRYMAQVAVQTVADAMSRETAAFTSEYMEGMNAVFDHLASNSTTTRLRISSVRWNATTSTNELVWSYGTRGLTPLPDTTFTLLAANDHEGLQALFGSDTSGTFADASLQMPVPDLATRIPPILNGEAMLLVESFSIWTPFAAVGLGQMRLQNVVAIRSRFSSQQVTDDDDGNGYVADPDDPATTDPAGTLPSPTTLISAPPSGTTRILTADFESWALPPEFGHQLVDAYGPTGGYLGPMGGDSWYRPFSMDLDLTGQNAYTRIEFDLILFDTWDGYHPRYASDRGDTVIFAMNGTPISVDAFYHGPFNHYARERSTTNYVGSSLVNVQMRPIEIYRRDLGGARADFDQRWRVVITGRNMPEHLRLGIMSGINGDLYDESFGMDNVAVYASGSADALAAVTPTFVADRQLIQSTDPYTQMPIYSGCPDVRYPAQWVNMTLDDVQTDHGIPRYAGGTTRLNACPDVPGDWYFSANPSLVFNYDNLGQSGIGSRLAITTDDRADGFRCDTNLLIRDPNGQWWHNDDIIDGVDRNSRIQFDNAVSGQYVIYLGNYFAEHCTTRLHFETY